MTWTNVGVFLTAVGIGLILPAGLVIRCARRIVADCTRNASTAGEELVAGCGDAPATGTPDGCDAE